MYVRFEEYRYNSIQNLNAGLDTNFDRQTNGKPDPILHLHCLSRCEN